MNHRYFRARSNAKKNENQKLASKFVKHDESDETDLVLMELNEDEAIESFIEICDKIKERGYAIWKVLTAYEHVIPNKTFIVSSGNARYIVDASHSSEMRFYLSKITAHAIAYYRDLKDKRMVQTLLAALYELACRYELSYQALFADICENLNEDGRHPFSFGSFFICFDEAAEKYMRPFPLELLSELYDMFLMDFIENADPEDMQILKEDKSRNWEKAIKVRLQNPALREECFLDVYTKTIPRAYPKLIPICAEIAFRQYFQDGYEHDIVERDYWERIVPEEYGVHDTVTAPSSALYLLSKFADMYVETKDASLRLLLIKRQLWSDIFDTILEDQFVEATELNEVLQILEEKVKVSEAELNEYIRICVFAAIETLTCCEDMEALTVLRRLLVTKKGYELIEHAIPEFVDMFGTSLDEFLVKLMPCSSEYIKSVLIDQLIGVEEVKPEDLVEHLPDDQEFTFEATNQVIESDECDNE